jgi:hypothetical protein
MGCGIVLPFVPPTTTLCVSKISRQQENRSVDALELMTDEYFRRGMTFEEYVSQARNYRSFIKDLIGKATVRPEEIEALVQACAGRSGPVRATVNTEDWCGDWACNAAYLNALFSGAGIEMRIFRGSEHGEIKERYEQDGDDHIPAVSLWDGNGRELARWIEAPAAVSEKKDAWKADNPEFIRTYQAKDSDPAAGKAWPKMYRDFMDMMARWYVEGMWNETGRELIERLETGR